MWALILIMAYISLIIGHRGFGGKDDLWEIICPESYGGVTFDLGPLLQGRMWPLQGVSSHGKPGKVLEFHYFFPGLEKSWKLTPGFGK